MFVDVLRRRALSGVVLMLTAGFAFPANPQAQPDAALIQRGKVLIEDRCSGCHATGVSGDSPVAKAPAFRSLKRKYPLENLAEALAEGIVTGHPDMPQFVFTPAEIDAIIAYLDSIGTP